MNLPDPLRCYRPWTMLIVLSLLGCRPGPSLAASDPPVARAYRAVLVDATDRPPDGWSRQAPFHAPRRQAAAIGDKLGGRIVDLWNTDFVVGGNAVAAWVARVDLEAVRNTKNVVLLVRRDDLERVTTALESVGFIHQNVAGIDLYLDGPEGSVRSAIHVVFAAEKVRLDDVLPAPDITESQPGPEFSVATLESLVRMKLTAFRLKDRLHLSDLLDVGLIDASWCDRFPPELAARFREVIDTAEREA